MIDQFHGGKLPNSKDDAQQKLKEKLQTTLEDEEMQAPDETGFGDDFSDSQQAAPIPPPLESFATPPPAAPAFPAEPEETPDPEPEPAPLAEPEFAAPPPPPVPTFEQENEPEPEPEPEFMAPPPPTPVFEPEPELEPELEPEPEIAAAPPPPPVTPPPPEPQAAPPLPDEKAYTPPAEGIEEEASPEYREHAEEAQQTEAQAEEEAFEAASQLIAKGLGLEQALQQLPSLPEHVKQRVVARLQQIQIEKERREHEMAQQTREKSQNRGLGARLFSLGMMGGLISQQTLEKIQMLFAQQPNLQQQIQQSGQMLLQAGAQPDLEFARSKVQMVGRAQATPQVGRGQGQQMGG